MNLNTLQEFRHGVYSCFGNAKDALFNLVDALASEAGARSFPELSLSPFFERTWASLYEALEDGQIDVERLRDIFIRFAPLPQAGQVVFLGVDTSNQAVYRLTRWAFSLIGFRSGTTTRQKRGLILSLTPIRRAMNALSFYEEALLSR